MELLFAAPELHHPRPPSSSSSSSFPAVAAKPAAEAATPLADVVAVLEHATLATKHLSSAPAAAAVDNSLALLALVSLRNAHEVIGSFLAKLGHRPPPVAGSDGGDEPMPDRAVAEADEATEAGDGSRTVEEVGEKMRDCGLQSKRRRKSLVPSPWTMGRVGDQDSQPDDPVVRRRWAIELVLQFHQ